MFCLEILKIIVFFVLFLTKDLHIIALDLRFKTKHNVNQQDELYPINNEEDDYTLKQNEVKNQLPFKLQYPYKDFEDLNYDYNYPDFDLSSDQVKRREASLNGSQNTYPSVLTKALEISLNSSVPLDAGESVFSNVAQKMNTSPLDLAKLLTKTKDSNDGDQFSQIIENYKRTKGISNTSTATFRSSPTQSSLNNLQYKLKQGYQDNGKNVEEQVELSDASNLAAILDHVLNKLESIRIMKNEDYEDNPDGVPCDIIGSWSSNTLGFCFDLQFHTDKTGYISPAEINNKVLSINVSECIPAKRHQIIDMEWKFTGSAIKQWGGPFYLYGQKRSESIVATFLGFCRTCNGIDTIFGSWNILSPTKDCHDISLGNEVKQDILRRVRMESKRKERFKDLLYQSRHGKL